MDNLDQYKIKQGVDGLDKSDQILYSAARNVKMQAWSQYSGHPVAAAIRADNSRIYIGVNVECVVFAEGETASRNALGNLVTSGGRGFSSWLLMGSSDIPCLPSGSDLQLAAEFASDESFVLCSNQDGTQVFKIPFAVMMPFAFSQRNLFPLRSTT